MLPGIKWVVAWDLCRFYIDGTLLCILLRGWSRCPACILILYLTEINLFAWILLSCDIKIESEGVDYCLLFFFSLLTESRIRRIQCAWSRKERVLNLVAVKWVKNPFIKLFFVLLLHFTSNCRFIADVSPRELLCGLFTVLAYKHASDLLPSFLQGNLLL